MTEEDLLARMHNAERLASSFNKAGFEEIVVAIEALASQMRYSLQHIESDWPDFSTHAASIRGYSFLSFQLCHNLCMKQLRKEVMQVYRDIPVRRPPQQLSLDLLA